MEKHYKEKQDKADKFDNVNYILGGEALQIVKHPPKEVNPRVEKEKKLFKADYREKVMVKGKGDKSKDSETEEDKQAQHDNSS